MGDLMAADLEDVSFIKLVSVQLFQSLLRIVKVIILDESKTTDFEKLMINQNIISYPTEELVLGSNGITKASSRNGPMVEQILRIIPADLSEMFSQV